MATTTESTFKTQALTLQQLTFAQLQPLKGSTVGVGMPVILQLDVPVKNRKEFEKHLTVTSSPNQAGSWSWFSDKEVHFRPKSYWKPGTKVSVNADLNSLDAGNGVYGQNSTSTSFTVGRSVVTKINLTPTRRRSTSTATSSAPSRSVAASPAGRPAAAPRSSSTSCR